MIKILHTPTDSEPFIVIDKPSGLPTAPIKENDDCALNQTLSLIKDNPFYEKAMNVKGKKEIEKGLVHRLDTDTSGLVLIALTQEFYDFITKEQSEGRFRKWYTATVDDNINAPNLLEGFPNIPEIAKKRSGIFTVSSRFRSYGIKSSCVRPVTQDCGKAALKKCGETIYSTQIDLSDISNKKAICSITAGFRHQVRCHLAWCGFPVCGDKIYNPENTTDGALMFRATKIAFSGFELSC